MTVRTLGWSDPPVNEGDIVKVKVLEVDRQGRIRRSMKAVEEGEGVTAAYAGVSLLQMRKSGGIVGKLAECLLPPRDGRK